MQRRGGGGPVNLLQPSMPFHFGITQLLSPSFDRSGHISQCEGRVGEEPDVSEAAAAAAVMDEYGTQT